MLYNLAYALMATPDMKKQKLSLSNQILIGFILGVLCGLFLGEDARIFRPLGSGFVMLLQMPIILFLFCAIVTGIGSLNLADAKKFTRSGGLILLVIWAIFILLSFFVSLSFPQRIVGSHFAASSSLNSNAPEMLNIFIPANPFQALADGIVPAIVVFSIFFAVALLFLPKRKTLIDNITVVQEALMKIAYWVALLAPLGIFAITANAAGSLTLLELSDLKFYILAITIWSLLLTFVVLPFLVTSLIPYSYREFVNPLKAAMLLAFTAGNTLIVLPLISEAINKYFDKFENVEKDAVKMTSGLVPLVYSLPSASIIYMIFILFTAWFYAVPLGISQYITLAVSTVMNGFSSDVVSIPFLLEQLKLPADAFDLYLPSTLIAIRLHSLLGVMAIAAICLLTGASVKKIYKFSFNKIITGVLLTVVLAAGSVITIRFWIPASKPEKEVFSSLVITEKASSVVRWQLPEKNKTGKTRSLKQIKQSGVLKVGYNTKALPFCYTNNKNELVGFDMAVAHLLAKDLNLSIEFIPFNYENLKQHLGAGHFDIAMSAITVSADRLASFRFTNPYLTNGFVLVMKDHRRKYFKTGSKIKKMKNLKIAVLGGSIYEKMAAAHFPNAEVVKVKAYADFARSGIADAIFWDENTGRTFSMMYPGYTVITPDVLSDKKQSFSYAVSAHHTDFILFLNTWLDMKKVSGDLDKLYRYWVLGQTGEGRKRWSVLGNILEKFFTK